MKTKTCPPLLALGFLVLSSLYFVSLRSYILFHGLAEVFSIVIAYSIFIVAWNARPLMENSYLLFLGIAYAFVGGLDLLHTLAYKGMGVFQGEATNLAAQLWIAGRSTQGLSLLVAPAFLGRRLRVEYVFLCYSAAAALVIASIFYWGTFPTCFVAGYGLTAFKKMSEYVICVVLVVAMVYLRAKRSHFDPGVLQLLAASIAVTIASELAFTLYTHAYGLPNLIGHFLKIVSFYLVYKALIETGLRKPYDLLFREVKLREEALQASEHRYRTLFENKIAGTVSSDPAGVLVLVNHAAATALGYGHPSELVGKPAEAIWYCKEDRDRAIAEVIRSGQIAYVEADLRRKDGSMLRALASTTVERDGQGRNTGITVSFMDISEIKRAQEILRRDKETLEELVKQRSADLVEAQKGLDEAKRLSGIGMLAATVAHELRNPLGVIKTAVYNIRRKQKDRALDKHLAHIELKVAESDQIIRNLLRYSNIKQPQYEAASLDQILKDSMAAAATRFSGQGTRLRADLSGLADVLVEVDVVQIREVFDNILNNAYQATADREGRIEVRGDLDCSGIVAIAVSDNGPGISAEDMDKIFEPFFTRKTRGTGLGLTICRELVSLHGGRIDIDSSQAGTTVRVRLPLSRGAA